MNKYVYYYANSMIELLDRFPVYYLNKSSLAILLCLVTVRPSYQDRIFAADDLPTFSKKTQMK